MSQGIVKGYLHTSNTLKPGNIEVDTSSYLRQCIKPSIKNKSPTSSYKSYYRRHKLVHILVIIETIQS